MEFNEEIIKGIEMQLDGNMSEFTLPIDELDGIRVLVQLLKYEKNKMPYMMIVSLYGTFDADDIHLNGSGAHLFSSDRFSDLITTLKFTMIFLENFIVDDYNGKLVTKKTNNCKMELSQLFKKFDRVKVKGDECCVCKDVFTIRKTSCGHPVCIRCISKLPTADEDEDFDDETLWCNRKCPMCRQDFTNFKK